MGFGPSFCGAICKALSTCTAVFLHARHHVAVKIERNTDFAVAKPLTGDLQVDARRQHGRGMSMTQIVSRARRDRRRRELAIAALMFSLVRTGMAHMPPPPPPPPPPPAF